MARTSLQDIRGLPDGLQQYNWDVIVPNMPGTADSRTFTYKAMTTSIPGILLEQVPIALHGVERRDAGRQNFTHQLEVTLLETRDIGTRDMMLKWSKTARDWITNTGSYKETYSTSLDLILYDDIPQAVRTIRLYGVWPETVGDSAVDGAQSGIVQTSVTFSFDYFEDIAGES